MQVLAKARRIERQAFGGSLLALNLIKPCRKNMLFFPHHSPYRAPPPDPISYIVVVNINIMSPDMQLPEEISPDLFRPNKRRRYYRKRIDTGDDQVSDAAGASAPPPPPSTSVIAKPAAPELQIIDELISQDANAGNIEAPTDGEPPLSVGELIRQRKAIQRRKGGIEFTNNNPSTAAKTEIALKTEDDTTPADIKSVIERFAPQTGHISESTDKHMYVLPPLADKVLTRRSD